MKARNPQWFIFSFFGLNAKWTNFFPNFLSILIFNAKKLIKTDPAEWWTTLGFTYYEKEATWVAAKDMVNAKELVQHFEETMVRGSNKIKNVSINKGINLF